MQELLAALTTQAMIKMLHLALDNPRAIEVGWCQLAGKQLCGGGDGGFWQHMSQQCILVANCAQGSVQHEVQ